VSKRNIHIERLQIRTRGISAETARTIVGDLGHELANELGKLKGSTRNIRIAQIDVGKTQVRPGELRSGLAKQIAGSIKSRMR